MFAGQILELKNIFLILIYENGFQYFYWMDQNHSYLFFEICDKILSQAYGKTYLRKTWRITKNSVSQSVSHNI